MNYELAKQLKDAGFPQHDTRAVSINILNGGLSDSSIEIVDYPPVGELIEACGDGFESLHKDPSGRFGPWYVQSYKKIGMRIGGNTPEEAVTMLWLALNDK